MSPLLTECPHCHYSMERLSDSPALQADYATGIDGTEGIDLSHIGGGLFSLFSRISLFDDLLQAGLGKITTQRYRRILRRYPRSLICTNTVCRHIMKVR